SLGGVVPLSAVTRTVTKYGVDLRWLALRSTFWKSAIVPFTIDTTVTRSLIPLCVPCPLASAGGTQATVADRPKPRCVPGAVRPPEPPVWADAPGWDWLGVL